MNPPRRLLLVGAGHAHLYLAARAARLHTAGIETWLIDPGHFWYSGRATGMLGGAFEPADDRIDAKALVEAAGGRFIRARARNIDAARRRLTLEDGRSLDYDWLSINAGSMVDRNVIAGCESDPTCWAAKPISKLARLRAVLETAFAAGEHPALAVIGGGPTGCEIAANLAALARRRERSCTIHLLHAGKRLVPQLPRGAGRRLHRHLERLGIGVRCQTQMVRREHGALATADGTTLAADHVVLAHGLRAPAWLDATGLAFDDGLITDAALRSIDDARVFAVGDCGRLRGHDLPRLGVFGVRQAPILLNNIEAAARGGEPDHYRPQSRWLSILDLGDGTGLASRGPLWWHGRVSLWVKHWLDSRFLESYRRATRVGR